MQAVLILAHKNLDQVISLVKILRTCFEVYIHIDKKCHISNLHKEAFEKLSVKFYSEIDVQWGGWSIGETTYFLIKEALKNNNIKYMHIISGEDWIIRSPKDIYDFYDENNKVYLQSEPAKGIIKSGEKVENWTKFYFNYDKSIIKRRTILGKILHRCLYWSQFLLKINKLEKSNIKDEIYHGAVWCDLPRDAAEYLIHTFDNNLIYKKIFSTSFCPDETWMQTLLENSSFKNRINNNFHRYINWNVKYNAYPAILDESDLDKIKNGDAQFMRKIDLSISKELLKKLDVLPE